MSEFFNGFSSDDPFDKRCIGNAMRSHDSQIGMACAVLSCYFLVSCAIPVNPQRDTFKWLNAWYQSGDTVARYQIIKASGEREILAGRIFKEWIFVRGSTREERASIEAELLRNEYLTMRVLYPVVLNHARNMTRAVSTKDVRYRELEEPGDNVERTYLRRVATNSRESEDEVSRYLSLLGRIAKTESDGVARSYLEKLAHYCDQGLAKLASDVCDDLATNNVAYRARQYRETNRYRDLEWIVERLFPGLHGEARIRQSVLQDEDLENYLGPPVSDDSAIGRIQPDPDSGYII